MVSLTSLYPFSPSSHSSSFFLLISSSSSSSTSGGQFSGKTWPEKSLSLPELHLIIGARRENALREVAERAQLLGSPRAIPLPTDISIAEQCSRLIEEAINQFGRLDHLVLCAGVAPVSMLEEMLDVTKAAPAMAVMSVIPIEVVRRLSKAVIDAACRGDEYLTVPFWIKTTFFVKKLFPEAVDWFNRWFCIPDPGFPATEALSKKLIDLPGLKDLLWPDSIRSPIIKSD